MAVDQRVVRDVFLLPGLLGTVASEWEPHFQAIGDAGFRPIGIDYPGHGTHHELTEPFTLPTVIDYILSEIDRHTDEPALVWGYSLGGFLSLELERSSPGRLGAIWTHATKFIWEDEDEIERFRNSLTLDTIAPRRADTLQKIHGDRWQSLLQANAELFEDILEYGATLDDLNAVRCPVLVTCGDQDELVKPEELERIADELIAGESTLLTGVRHPLHSTRSSLIIPVAAEFSHRAGS